MRKSAHDSSYIALIEWLVTARERQGLSVRELAHLIDEPHSVVVKTELRSRKLSILEYHQYCKALNLDPAEGLSILDE